MRLAVLAVSAALLAPSVASAQEPGPNAPTVVKSLKVPGMEVRYLDFKWDPAVWDGLEKGGSTNPVTKRSWAIARIVLYERALKIGDAPLRAGTNALLVLNPNLDGKGLTLEIRRVDMRDDVFQKINVVAEPPPGETIYKAPVSFETVGTTADRMTMTLAEAEGKVHLGVHFGNRSLKLEFTS
jgi:hypothetical protein